MKVARHFTSDRAQPFEGIDFEDRSSRIANPDGSVVFEAKDIAVPKGWSQVAVDILSQKYFRKAGIPTRLRRVPEPDVPQWLWRSEPDDEELAEMLTTQLCDLGYRHCQKLLGFLDGAPRATCNRLIPLSY